MNDRDHFNLDEWCKELYRYISSKNVTEAQLNLAKLEIERLSMYIDVKIVRNQIK